MSTEDVKAAGGLVLVTGAASPIGRAIANEFASEGRDVILHDYGSVEDVSAPLKSEHPSVSVSAVTGNMSDPAFTGKLLDALGSRRLRVFAHAGGFAPSTKSAQESFESNFTATRKLVETLQPKMEAEGVIILVASLGGISVKNSFVDFGVKRHAMGGFSPTVWMLSKSHRTSDAVAKRCIQLYVKQKAADLSPLGVRIVSVSPSLMNGDKAEPQAKEGTAPTTSPEQAAAKRPARPEDVAPVVAFLASPGAAYITGADIPVNGGKKAQRQKPSETTTAAPKTSRLSKLQQKNAERTRLAHQQASRPTTREDKGKAAVEAKKEAQNTPLPDTGKETVSENATESKEVAEGEAKTDAKETGAPDAAAVTNAIDFAPPQDESKKEEDVAAEQSNKTDANQDEPVGDSTVAVSADANEADATDTVDNNQETEKDESAGAASAAAVTGSTASDTTKPTEDGAAAATQPPAQGPKSAFGSVRTKLGKIQREGLGSQRFPRPQTAPAADQQQQQQTQKEGDDKKKEGNAQGAQSGLGSLRARLDRMQQESMRRQKSAHEAAKTNGERRPSSSRGGLQSVVGSVRSKFDQLQQESLDRIQQRAESDKTATVKNGGGSGSGTDGGDKAAAKGSSGGSNLRSRMSTRLHKIQERNAARAQAGSSRPADTATGILQPAADEGKSGQQADAVKPEAGRDAAAAQADSSAPDETEAASSDPEPKGEGSGDAVKWTEDQQAVGKDAVVEPEAKATDVEGSPQAAEQEATVKEVKAG